MSSRPIKFLGYMLPYPVKCTLGISAQGQRQKHVWKQILRENNMECES